MTQVEFDHLPPYIGAHDLMNISQYVSSYAKDFPAWIWRAGLPGGSGVRSA